MEILSVDIFGSRIHEHIFQKSETGICSSLHGIGIFRCFALAPNAARVAYHLSATHNAVLSFHLHHPMRRFAINLHQYLWLAVRMVENVVVQELSVLVESRQLCVNNFQHLHRSHQFIRHVRQQKIFVIHDVVRRAPSRSRFDYLVGSR